MFLASGDSKETVPALGDPGESGNAIWGGVGPPPGGAFFLWRSRLLLPAGIQQTGKSLSACTQGNTPGFAIQPRSEIARKK